MKGHVRFYQSLRSAHLERAHQFDPATILYRNRNYDFDAVLAEGLDLVQVHRTGDLVRAIMGSRIEVVEVNEPLAREAIKDSALVVALVRLSSLRHRRRAEIVTYAIENRIPFTDMDDATRGGRVRARAERLLTRFVSRNIDRIAFGTTSARDAYSTPVTPVEGAAQVIVPALPLPCHCLDADLPLVREPQVLFLGRWDQRKGIRQVLEAWPLLAVERPDARLVIVGKGPLEADVREFCDRRSDATLMLDPPRQDLHALLSSAQVLVLASQPSPVWREQVGLPLVEGLAHGCTIVTTDQTGLASWLANHGHHVLASPSAPPQLAEALQLALQVPLPPAQVLGSLPPVDGRLEADRWMFSR